MSIVMDDPVSHPAHYTDGKIETIDFIDDKKLDFCLGNAVKYISRAGKKDPDKKIEDLMKAAWYINHEIINLRKEEMKADGEPDVWTATPEHLLGRVAKKEVREE